MLHAFHALAKSAEFDVTFLEVDANGLVDPDDLAEAIRKDTTLASIMSANNETGVCQPLRELGEICAKRGVIFHTDAIQSAGKQPIDLRGWQTSALSLTAHKLHGPLGAGALWLKAGVPMTRMMEGGAHENERRPGTENAPAIAASPRRCDCMATSIPPRRSGQFRWIEALWRELEKLRGIRRNGDPVRRLPNTLNVSFHGLHGEDLLIASISPGSPSPAARPASSARCSPHTFSRPWACRPTGPPPRCAFPLALMSTTRISQKSSDARVRL